MSLLLNLFSVLFLLLVIRTALCYSLIRSIIFVSAGSVILCICYLLMDAPDVAMTEAALGACLSTVVLLGLIKYIPDQIGVQHRSRLGLLLCATLALCFMYVGYDSFYSFGDGSTPVHLHISKYYIDNAETQVGIPSFVTAILASYRGYDTLGETSVILIAALGVYLVFSTENNSPRVVEGDPELKSSVILKLTIKLITPFILLFGVYVQLYGEVSPGGGFQAGSIFASCAIARSFLYGGYNSTTYLIPAVIGVMIYALVGIASILIGGEFLNHSVLAIDPVVGQKIGIFIIELGIGMTVFSSMMLIYSVLDGSDTTSHS